MDYQQDKIRVITDRLVSTEIMDDSVRRGIRLVKTYGDSTITQTIWLYDHSSRIDFETEVDWHQLM